MAFSNVSLSFPPSIEQKRYTHQRMQWFQKAVVTTGCFFSIYQVWQEHYWLAGGVGLASYLAHDGIYLVGKKIFNIAPDNELVILKELTDRGVEVVINDNSSNHCTVDRLSCLLQVHWDTQKLPPSELRWVLDYVHPNATKVELTVGREVRMTQTLINNIVESFTFFSKGN